MGKRPTSERLKIVSGTDKRHIRKTPKVQPLITMWTTPKHMGTHARRLWRGLGAQLIRNGILTNLDRGAFEALCTCYGMICMCREVLNRDGFSVEDSRGSVKKRPEVTILTQNMALYRQYCQEFGITPAARERLGVSVQDQDESEWALLTKPVN
jgi:P27 family predicted phage terminase small subunit